MSRYTLYPWILLLVLLASAIWASVELGLWLSTGDMHPKSLLIPVTFLVHAFCIILVRPTIDPKSPGRRADKLLFWVTIWALILNLVLLVFWWEMRSFWAIILGGTSLILALCLASFHLKGIKKGLSRWTVVLIGPACLGLLTVTLLYWFKATPPLIYELLEYWLALSVILGAIYAFLVIFKLKADKSMPAA